MNKAKFRKDLTALLDSYGFGQESLTVPAILADYLCSCIVVFNRSIKARDVWWIKEFEAVMDEAKQLDEVTSIRKKDKQPSKISSEEWAKLYDQVLPKPNKDVN